MSTNLRPQTASERITYLSSAGLSDAEAFDYRHSMAADTYRLRIGRRRETRSDFETIMRIVDGYVLSDYRSTPVVRSRDLVSLRKDGRSYVKIRQYVSGEGCTLASDQGSFKLLRGDIHVIDQSREFTEVCMGGHQYNLFLPHDEIGFDPAKHGPSLSFTRGTPTGKLLEAAFAHVFPSFSSANYQHIAKATYDLITLLRTVLEGGAESGLESTVAAARILAVHRLVAENLGDPELKPSTIVKMVGFSRATVYRDFSHEGGLERFIFKTRLERAFDLLSKSHPRRGVVDRVANEVGFGSIHHFSNAFHDYFQLRPSDICGLFCEDILSEGDIDLERLSDRVEEGKRFFEVVRGIAC